MSKYNLSYLNSEIERRRTENDESYRDLQQYVNTRILERTLEDAEADLAGDAQSVYKALRGDGVSSGRRAEVRTKLSNVGIDVDDLERDFVSHQTVSKHVKTCLEITPNDAEPANIEDARGLIEWARDRDETIINRTLERLRKSVEIETGDLYVNHSVRVTCENCGSSYRVQELLEQGGCQCKADEDVA